jgi:VIT1/CCC1 family predicted Fe2+/Mn2+ transporter
VESGGFLRNVVYGFNDGLTANFGLVAGVLGATASQQHEAVVVAGVAGVIADALSMGSSGYLAAKSEQECTRTKSRWNATRSRTCPSSSVMNSP